jgi:hypothetical protein
VLWHYVLREAEQLATAKISKLGSAPEAAFKLLLWPEAAKPDPSKKQEPESLPLNCPPFLHVSGRSRSGIG